MQKMQEENMRVLEDIKKGQTYISGRFMTGDAKIEKTNSKKYRSNHEDCQIAQMKNLTNGMAVNTVDETKLSQA
eukprot:4925643-Ditylum_brightwellii.AAC.1